jgi:hypothetical protein
LVQSFYRLLKWGGTLVIGNLRKSNTTKAFCHLLVRWHLIHKNEDEMKEWTEGLSGANVTFDFDPKKTQAFIVIHKK